VALPLRNKADLEKDIRKIFYALGWKDDQELLDALQSETCVRMKPQGL
jgi:hypothetical protein